MLTRKRLTTALCCVFAVWALGFATEVHSQSYTFTTIAGLAGASGSSDGTNSDARFYFPAGIAVDGAGSLYVAEILNHTIRKIALRGTNWVVSTLAGLAGVRDHNDGTNSDARFYSPTGIAVDSTEHLYVTDTANFTIRQVAAFGTNWVVSTIAGFSGNMGSTDGAGRKAAFNFPNSIAVDTQGNLYVADQSNHTIRRITPPANRDWMVSTIAGLALQPGSADGTGSDARFNKPWGVAVDIAGNLYVADYGNHTIRKGLPSWGAIPSLQMLLLANEVVLSWPSSATNFVLETSGRLSGPWGPLTNGLTTNAESLVLTNRLETPAAFYRLRRQ